jgi:spore germination protein KB
MNKEIVSSKQALSIVVTFILGSSVILGTNREAMQDSWISSLIAIAAFIPFAFLYGRILKLYPGMDFFDIIVKVLGSLLGKIIIVLFSWYAIHLGALVLRNFTEFIRVEELPTTPQLLFFILMSTMCIYVVKSGVDNLGKCSVVILIFYIFILVSVTLFSLGEFEYNNLLPVMRQGMDKILLGSFSNLTFPLAETVLLLPLISSLKPKESPYKVYFWGGVLGGGMLLIGTIKNILIVGFPMLSEVFFPHIEAAKLIVIGGSLTDVLARIEETVVIAFTFTCFVKISGCLFAATKGIARVFNINKYKKLAVPVSFIMIALASILYSSLGEMIGWLPVYKYYALPFEILLPLLIFIAGEIKIRKQKKETVPQATQS